MVVFDTTILIALLYPEAPPPRHPESNDPVEAFRERIDYLVTQLERSRDKIIIPTPTISEFLVRADEATPEYLDMIHKSPVFLPTPFDVLAAVEVAAMTRSALDTTGSRKDEQEGTWAKIKFDRQIVAIAKVNEATAIYSDDRGIFKLGQKQGIEVMRIADLPLPPGETQMTMNLPPREKSENG